jgi:hypothetical protein
VNINIGENSILKTKGRNVKVADAGRDMKAAASIQSFLLTAREAGRTW